MRMTLNFSNCEAIRSRHRLRCRALAIPAALLLTLSLGAPSRGESLNLILGNFQTTSSTTGSFEVDLVNNYGTSVTVSDFSIELKLSGLAGVLFTGAATDTTAFPYIFTGVGGPPPFSGSTFPTTDLVAGDSVFTAPFYITLPSTGPGSEVGLALVTYDTSGALPGTAFISIGPGTSVSDSVTNPTQSVDYQLNYSTPAGQIVVSGVVIPEPSALILLATALPCVAGVFCRARTAVRIRSAEAKS